MLPSFIWGYSLRSTVLWGAAVGAAYFLYSFYKRTRRNANLKGYFKDKVVLITGASSGLGKELSVQLHELGAKLILAARSLDKLNNLAQDLSNFPTDGTHTPVCRYLDLSDEESLRNIAGNGVDRIDVIINNAGISIRGNCEQIQMNVHKQIMQVNHFGGVALTQNLLPYVRKAVEMNGVANIVSVNSVQGCIALPMRSAYSASKHASKAYMDSLRAELSYTDPLIRVLCVYPGYINTNLSKNSLTPSGDKYGKVDENTATGWPAEKVGRIILEGIAEGRKEVYACTYKPNIAILLRYVLPSVYFYIMEKRARKEFNSGRNS